MIEEKFPGGIPISTFDLFLKKLTEGRILLLNLISKGSHSSFHFKNGPDNLGKFIKENLGVADSADSLLTGTAPTN
ncbi:MAG: hypothetical protein K0U84_04785 [Actinomycetia bacterium]|nr:hypothetical protein [Actinomycetes bacterium]